MLARTLLAGIQESMCPTVEENYDLETELKYDFSEEATTESYWISEAIESAFEDIIHIDKVYHVADIKGEMQAFTENSTPEEIGIMLEGIITGGITRVIDTLEKLISKLNDWMKKIIEQVKSIFSNGSKFVKNARKIIDDKSTNSAKYGKYQYSTFKYDFEAGNNIITSLASKLKLSMEGKMPTKEEQKEAEQMPDAAEQAEAQADVETDAKDVEDSISEESASGMTDDEWDRLMESILENIDDEDYAKFADEESVEENALDVMTEEDFESTLESIMAELIEAEDEVTMESEEFILEAVNTSDILSKVCEQVSKGKASNQGELMTYLRKKYRSDMNKKQIFTFFEDVSAQKMMDFVDGGKKAIETLKKDRKDIIEAANKQVKEMNTKASKLIAEKKEGAYNALSRQATTLTAMVELIHQALNIKIETYKEALGEYTRILKGLVLYKGEKYVDESYVVSEAKKEEEEAMAADAVTPAEGEGEEMPTDGEAAADTAAIAKAAKESDKKQPMKEGACGTKEGKCGTKEAAISEVEPAKNEMPSEGQASTSGEEVPEEQEDAAAKESYEADDDALLSLFESAFSYL